jgi:hypothetical protein
MLRLIVALLAVMPVTAPAASVTLTPSDWAQWQPAGADSPPLHELLAALERVPGGRVVVRHGGGERGAHWGEAMRDWLVARGLPSARIELVPTSFDGERLELDVGPAPAR